MEAFKPGDRVRCVRPSSVQPFLVLDDIYTVVKFTESGVKPLVQVEGSYILWQVNRFELADLQATVTPQLFDYPETDEDKERAAREKLRAYKRGMRDWLYGTTSEDQS